MEKTRDFVNRYNHHFLHTNVRCCHVFQFQLRFPLTRAVSTSCFNRRKMLMQRNPQPLKLIPQVPAAEPIGLETLTFTIDATNREAWAYFFSFVSGDIVNVEDAENSEVWDIGFQRTQVKLRMGVSADQEWGVLLC